MPGTFGTTTRNALRWLKGASLVSDVDEGFQLLAEDCDTKLVSWWEDTLAKRPAAGQPNRFFKATDINVIFHDTGTIWEPVAPGMVEAVSTVSVEAKRGELVRMVTSGTTLTLPTPAVNGPVTVVCDPAAATGIKVTASSGSIFGQFITGVATVTLLPNQSCRFWPTGGNWFIVAGEPKREQVYVSKAFSKAEAEAGVEPSATRPAMVSFKEAFGTAPGLTVGGVNVASATSVFVPPGQKWKAQDANTAYTILL